MARASPRRPAPSPRAARPEKPRRTAEHPGTCSPGRRMGVPLVHTRARPPGTRPRPGQASRSASAPSLFSVRLSDGRASPGLSSRLTRLPPTSRSLEPPAFRPPRGSGPPLPLGRRSASHSESRDGPRRAGRFAARGPGRSPRITWAPPRTLSRSQSGGAPVRSGWPWGADK